MLLWCMIENFILKCGFEKRGIFNKNLFYIKRSMEISGKGLLHFYQQASSFRVGVYSQNVYSHNVYCARMSIPIMSTVPNCLFLKCLLFKKIHKFMKKRIKEKKEISIAESTTEDR